MATYLQSEVRYWFDSGTVEFNDLNDEQKDSLLIALFEDKLAIFNDDFLGEFLLESLEEAGQHLINEIIVGKYDGIRTAIRAYSNKHRILEKAWIKEVDRLEAQFIEQRRLRAIAVND